MSLADQLATGLTSARRKSRRSRRAVAQELGVAPNTLRELELGLANPTLRRVEDVADALGLELELRVTPRKARR